MAILFQIHMNSYNIKPENRNDRSSKTAGSRICEMICHNQIEFKESLKTDTGGLSGIQNSLKSGGREKNKYFFVSFFFFLIFTFIYISLMRTKISGDELQIRSVI